MNVQILLSTYNGERYLKPQIESLLAQNYPDLKILARDDGSNDRTVHLLQEYAGHCPDIEILPREHVGFVQSFFELISRASPRVDYFALCDQDDVWKADKISRAVDVLNRHSAQIPLLYCSRVAIVDENLLPLGYSPIPRRPLTFRNALVECQARGCTLVFNRAARQLLLDNFPKEAWSHDMWISLVAAAFGTIIYDPQPRILYRKHFTNAVGITIRMKDTWRVKIAQFLKDRKLHLVVKQAEEFRRIYGPVLPDEHRNVIERFLNSRKKFWTRLRYAWACDVYRQRIVDQCILKARIALDLL